MIPSLTRASRLICDAKEEERERERERRERETEQGREKESRRETTIKEKYSYKGVEDLDSKVRILPQP